LWARLRYARLLSLARKSQRGVEESPGRWFGIAAVVGFLLLVMTNAGRIARMIRMRGLRVHPERSPEQAATMWYERMARYMERRGMQKSTMQTAQEFLRVIAEEGLRARVRRFTDAYESARFGNSADDARRLPELYEEVASATRN